MAKREKILGFDVGPYMPVIVLGGVGVAAYFVGKNLGWWGGTTGTTNMSADPATVSKDLAAASNVEPPNYQSTQYANFADTIYQSPDFNTVNGILDQIWNDADFLSLQAAFGTRKACPWWAGAALDLVGCQNVGLSVFINSNFSSGQIAQLNQTLAYNNVTYHF